MSDLRVTNLKGRTAGSSPTLPDGVVISGIATATNVSVGSSVTAGTFHGNGAGLTGLNIPASSDWRDSSLF